MCCLPHVTCSIPRITSAQDTPNALVAQHTGTSAKYSSGMPHTGTCAKYSSGMLVCNLTAACYYSQLVNSTEQNSYSEACSFPPCHEPCSQKQANCLYSGFGGLEVACWPLVLKFASSNPAEAVGKNPQHAFLRKGSKAVGPMS